MCCRRMRARATFIAYIKLPLLEAVCFYHHAPLVTYLTSLHPGARRDIAVQDEQFYNIVKLTFYVTRPD